jgi:hypothetical protein
MDAEDRNAILEAIIFQTNETQRAIESLFDQAVCLGQQQGLKALVAKRNFLDGLLARTQNSIEPKP